jgi:hypothetical protein
MRIPVELPAVAVIRCPAGRVQAIQAVDATRKRNLTFDSPADTFEPK